MASNVGSETLNDKHVPPKKALQERDLQRPPWGESQPRDPKMQWLDKNENPDSELAERITGILAGMPATVPTSYPELSPLYRKLAEFYGTNVNNLILANGSDGLIRSVFEAFVDDGDTVLHTDPTFAMYSVYCDMFGARGVNVQHERRAGSVGLDVDTLLDVIAQERPRVVCVPNPDSPTGSVIAITDLTRIIEAAADTGAVALVDEAYYPFYRDTVIPNVGTYDNLLVTRSTGKAWGMAGLRIGVGVGSESLIAQLHRVRPMYECNAVGAYVLERMLDHYDEVEAAVARLVEGRDWFAQRMRELGYEVIPTHGNFVHVAFGSDESEIAHALSDIVYYRRGTDHPALKGFSRFSATTTENFDVIVQKIRECRG